MNKKLTLIFWDPTKRIAKPSARIHASGKLGFNMDASIYMGLSTFPSFRVATQDGDKDTECIFLIDDGIPHKQDTPPALRVAKAGRYYYLNIKNVLAKLELDYVKHKRVYDITRVPYEGNDIYKLQRRTLHVRNKNGGGDDGHEHA